MTSPLVGVLVGGGLTLVGGVVGQATSHAFTLRRDRESRREARLTNLADVRLKAILDLQELAGSACAEAINRPALTSRQELAEHHARLVSMMVGLAVPRARIDDAQTHELSDAVLRRLTDVQSAYDARRHDEGERAVTALRRDLDALVERTQALIEIERLRLTAQSTE